MVQVADAGGTRPVNPAAAAISAAASAPAPQAVAIPEAAAQPRMPSDSFEGIPETIRIKSGDTLGSLVAKYQISYDKLKELNPEVFKEGPDAQGRKRANDGHWIYPGEVIRLRADSPAKPPAAVTDPTPPAATALPSPNSRVIEAAKAAIDSAKLTPATTANGRQLSSEALSKAQEMLKLIPMSDPARKQYESAVDTFAKTVLTAYPAEAQPAGGIVGSRERFDASSDRFNQEIKSYHDAASLPAKSRKESQAASRDLAIRHFSEAAGASRGMPSEEAKVEARERLEMMEFALAEIGVNAAAIALARGEGTPQASTPTSREATFVERDKNQDGYLSGTELDKKAKAFDADGNQRVTREEWEMGQMAEREVGWKNEFKQADANQDGWLSGSEATKFSAADANGDFEVTEAEHLASKRAQVMNGVYDEDFAARDKNQDSYLSGNELDAATRAFDANRDGKVTREEYMAAKSGAKRPGDAVMTTMPVGTVPAATPQPTAPSNPFGAFEASSARFNEAAARNDMLAMTTAYQDSAYAVAAMAAGPERDMLAAQLEIMGFTLQQAYTASGSPVAAGGTAAGLTPQPINPGIQVPATAVPGLVQPGMMTPQIVPVQAGYPASAYPAQAVAPVTAAAQPAEPPRQTYTSVWSSPDFLSEAMGYNKPAPAGQGNQSAQGTGNTSGTGATAGSTDATAATAPKVNEQAVREINAFLQRADADAVRDMLANRPELLYDSQPNQKATMIQLLVEGRTDAGDRLAIVNILDMAAKTDQVDMMLKQLDSLYGGASKGIKRMLEDLDKDTKGAALKAMFTPSLMQYRKYDPAAFDAVTAAMTKDDIKLLMGSMGYGVSAPWMSVFSAQARQTMISKLSSGFNLFGGGAEKQMIAALEQAAVAYAPQVELPAK